MITIDDSHTRDMDDAIEVEETPSGWTVRVAIADASRIVTPGSDLDKAARERGNTLYFAAGNSPMLPRDVSEWQLSLWPVKYRRAVIAEIRLSAALDVERTTLSLDTIVSAHKLSYNQIPALLASNEKYDDAIEALPGLLRAAQKLSLGLLAKRRAEGAMVLYDLNNGWVTTEEGAIRKLKDHTETIGYIIVQELMVLANTAVALYAVDHKIPFLFRNHQAKANTQVERSEIQKFIDDAAVNPVIDLESFQSRTHKFFDKAVYDAELIGHAGLNVKAYTHFTSPIRRYADLVVHQQLRAHLKGQPLPHTEESLTATAIHLNELALKARESDSAHFKDRAEVRAARQVETRKLDGLIPKQFERVVKMEVRSGGSPSEALTEAWQRRLNHGSVPTICITTVLMHGLEPDEAGAGLKRVPVADGWDVLKIAAVRFLMGHTPDAVSILAQAAALGWPAAKCATTQHGESPNALFTAFAQMLVDGEVVEVTERATKIKEAQQLASVSLLARLAKAPAPEFEAPVTVAPPPTPKAATGPDPNKHPVSQLMERAQSDRCPPPTFDFTLKGESHLPVVTCTATFLGQTVSVVSASKQAAKTEAARQLLGMISTGQVREIEAR